jgi:hypothetical protein|tara:strand:+ start:66 stop:323 length:258 start_codon:yes stop_codon:yes gene_type:complete
VKYQYKVTNFQGIVKESDNDKGDKLAAQLESLFEDYAKDGWELQGQYKFPCKIEGGCWSSLLALVGQGNADQYLDIYQLVFRKEV